MSVEAKMTVEEETESAAMREAREEAARQQRYVRERLERKPSEQITLDDIIYEMQHGANNNNGNAAAGSNSNPSASESGVFSSAESNGEGGGGDVYAQLEQKERDLMLAAELGKALLDKNEELSRQNERIAEEFSSKLEELEQEKYHLRRRLETAQEEYELKTSELQSDLSSLQSQLDEAAANSKQTEKEKSMLITTLTEQNQRLTGQLKERSKAEEAMTLELQQLRDQVNLKRTSMNEHVSHLDMLREEITMMTERKMDLERRIELLQGEREGLSSTLDESADRIIMLEKQSREQESLLRTNETTIDELRATNQALQDRLEGMYKSSMSLSPAAAAAAASGNMSLLNEMELSDSERSGRPSRAFSVDEDDVECEHPPGTNMAMLETKELKEEMLSAYQQMRSLIGQLRRREKQQLQQKRKRQQQQQQQQPSPLPEEEDEEEDEDEESRMAEEEATCASSSSSSDEATTVASVKPGLLKSCVQELKGLLHDLLRKESKGACLSCGGDTNERLRLEVQLHKATEAREKGERRVKQMEEEAKRKDEEILELKSKLSVTEVQLSAATEERDTLKDDLSSTSAGRDELIKKAWEVRDAAVKRKNNTQIELAKSRIDVMQINSQLLESIQQKVELSQQLDQWQADMEELLEDQMVKKMRAQEVKVKGQSANNGGDSDSSQTESRTSKILSFFGRGDIFKKS